jgi:hypothetical protein
MKRLDYRTTDAKYNNGRTREMERRRLSSVRVPFFLCLFFNNRHNDQEGVGKG